MYFEGIEQNQTRHLIINSLLELLEKRDYSAITINMLMDQFAETLLKNHASGMEEVAIAYFQSWEQYIDVLLLLKKAHVLYFIEDNLTELITNVAKKVKHIPDGIPLEQLTRLYSKYNYEFSIKLAGFWKATIIWCEENPRKSPEEMAKIITSLLS